MTRKFLHEEIYRGADQLAKLALPQLTISGAGALGSHLVDNLARQGFKRLEPFTMDELKAMLPILPIPKFAESL